MSDQRRNIDDALYAHFVTFAVDGRRKLLNCDHPCRILLGVLNELLDSFSARCAGYVIMPEHVHAVIWFPCTGQLSKFMHAWKRQSSLHIRKWYRSEAAEYLRESGLGDRFWQSKYYAFEIYEQRTLEQKIQYMHQNPVRRGLVLRPADWKWSSARWYERKQTVGVPIELVD